MVAAAEGLIEDIHGLGKVLAVAGILVLLDTARTNTPSTSSTVTVCRCYICNGEYKQVYNNAPKCRRSEGRLV